MQHRLATYTTAGTALVMSSSATADSITFSPIAASSIPTLSGTLLVVMSILLGLAAMYVFKKQDTGKISLSLFALVAGAYIAGTGGFKLIGYAEAGNLPPLPGVVQIKNQSGGEFPIVEGPNLYLNLSGKALRVTKIEIESPTCPDQELREVSTQESQKIGAEIKTCKVGSVLADQEECLILCYGDNLG
jgi:hypothetical protein